MHYYLFNIILLYLLNYKNIVCLNKKLYFYSKTKLLNIYIIDFITFKYNIFFKNKL